MQPLVSIIVPVYNVEKYLNKCIFSIINQSYKNLQILLVDDGSADASPQICDKYAAVDERITVYHNSNHGPSYSRNFGLERSNGEYITFIDSDDWLEENYVTNLVQAIIETGTELAISPNFLDYPDKSVTESVDESKLTGKLQQDLVKLYRLTPSPCCKLYRKDIICKYNIKFPSGKSYSEDRVFNYIYLQNIKSYVYIDIPQYHYLQFVGNSLTKQRTMKAFDDAMYALEMERDFLLAVDANGKYEMLLLSLGPYLMTFWQTVETGASYKEYCKRFKRTKEIVPVAYSFSSLKNAVASCAYLLNLPCVFYICKKIKQSLKKRQDRQ